MIAEECELCNGSSFKYFDAQVSDEGPAHPLEVDPLMICCGDFFVGGASWVRYRERVQNPRLCELLAMRYRRMRQKEEYLHRFFASLDPPVLANRRRLRRRLRRARGEPHAGSSAGLRAPKEEPTEEELISLESHRYNFYYRLYDDGV